MEWQELSAVAQVVATALAVTIAVIGVARWGSKRVLALGAERRRRVVERHAQELERRAAALVRDGYRGASADVGVSLQLDSDNDRAAAALLVAENRARLDADGRLCFVVDRLDPYARRLVDALVARDRRESAFGRVIA